MTVVRLPISCTSSMACWLHDPSVSMATGKKGVFSSPDTCSLAACLAAVASGAQMGLSPSIINYYYLIIILPLEVEITELTAKFKN